MWPSIIREVIKHHKKNLQIFIQGKPEREAPILGMAGVSQVTEDEGSRFVNNMRLQLVGEEDYPSRSPIFVVSLATHSGKSQRDAYHRRHDVLSQWRGYGGDAGVAIVFDTAHIDNLLQAEKRRFLYWPFRIS